MWFSFVFGVPLYYTLMLSKSIPFPYSNFTCTTSSTTAAPAAWGDPVGKEKMIGGRDGPSR